MTIPHEGGSTGILVLRDDDHDDVLVLDRLRSDPSIEFVDRFAEQLACGACCHSLIQIC